MSLPKPEAGLVIRYAYLWHREFLEGREDASKDRPCAIVLTSIDDGGEEEILVLPVTHSPPHASQVAIEIPAPIKQRLRLDGDRSWIMLDEANVFHWPGTDLARDPITQEFAYGLLPSRFFDEVLRRFIANVEAGRAKRVTRTE